MPAGNPLAYFQPGATPQLGIQSFDDPSFLPTVDVNTVTPAFPNYAPINFGMPQMIAPNAPSPQPIQQPVAPAAPQTISQRLKAMMGGGLPAPTPTPSAPQSFVPNFSAPAPQSFALNGGQVQAPNILPATIA